MHILESLLDDVQNERYERRRLFPKKVAGYNWAVFFEPKRYFGIRQPPSFDVWPLVQWPPSERITSLISAHASPR